MAVLYCTVLYCCGVCRTVFVVADREFVDRSASIYIATTLRVAGYFVHTCDHIDTAPSLWNISIDSFGIPDVIVIPAQLHASIWDRLSIDSQNALRTFVQNGGILICCYFRGTEIINHITSLLHLFSFIYTQTP